MPSHQVFLLLLLAVTLGILCYSLFLQKLATGRQARSMQAVQESIERQREALQLQKENNELLKAILAVLRERG